MSIIKAFPGHKIARHCFCLISVLLLFITCPNEVKPPDVYQITYYNHYFEVLKSVEIANMVFEDIGIDGEQIIVNVPYGEHRITAITQSGLKIEAVVSLVGSKSSVRIILTENGKLKLES